MITVANYPQQKGNIDWSKLPKEVKQLEQQVESWLQFYDKSEKIQQTVDLYLKKVNTAFAKAEKKVIKPKKNDQKPKNLSQFKKYLKANIGSVLYFTGKYPSGEIHDTREIALVQNDSVMFKSSEGREPWTYFGKAKTWDFTDNYASVNLGNGGKLMYHYEKPKGWSIGPTRLGQNPTKNQKSTKTTTSKKKSTSKTIAKKVDAKTVDSFDKEFLLLRRFFNKVKHKKPLIFKDLRLLYMAFQKAIVGRDVRNTSDHALLFTETNRKVVKLYKIAQKTNTEVLPVYKDQNFLPRLKKYVEGQKVNYAVTLLRSFISLQGTSPEKKRVQNLLKRFENSLTKKRITKDNRLFNEVQFAVKELKDYLMTNDPIETKPYGLSKSANVCDNRVKCKGLDSNGQLKKGYYFSKGGDVVKTGTRKKKGLSAPRLTNSQRLKAQKQAIAKDLGLPYSTIFQDNGRLKKGFVYQAPGVVVRQGKTPRTPAVKKNQSKPKVPPKAKSKGLGCPAPAPKKPQPSPATKKRYSAQDIMTMDFKKMTLPPEWAILFPDAPGKMHLAFMGKPKNGKSMSACQWGAVVGKGKKILYNFADQGINASTKKILEISGLARLSDLTVTSTRTLDELEQDIKEVQPDVVFIDMINNYIDNEGATPADFENRFIHGYPDISFNLVFEATKTGDFKGDQKWTHIVDQLINIEDYVMNSRGRYGSGKRITWDDQVQKINPSLHQEVCEALDLFKEQNGIGATEVNTPPVTFLDIY